MPGPFPGMDPWLEAPDLWKGFHDTMVAKTKESLQPDLNQRGDYVESGETGVGRRESDSSEFYPFPLRPRLPRVAVPLKTEDADAV